MVKSFHFETIWSLKMRIDFKPETMCLIVTRAHTVVVVCIINTVVSYLGGSPAYILDVYNLECKNIHNLIK